MTKKKSGGYHTSKSSAKVAGRVRSRQMHAAMGKHRRQKTKAKLSKSREDLLQEGLNLADNVPF